MQAVQKLGGPFGAAILGSALNATYQGRLPGAGLPAPVAEAARLSVFAGVAAAGRLGAAAPLEAVRSAFLAGMDAALGAAAAFALVGMLLALLFLPARRGAAVGAGRVESAPGRAASRA